MVVGLLASPSSQAVQKKTKPLACEVQQGGGLTRLVALTDPKTGACTGFEVLDARGRVVSMHRNVVFGGGRFITSKDGRRIVYVNTRPRASLRRDGSFITTVGVIKSAPKPVEALVIFFDGRVVLRKTLGDLLTRPFLSHIESGRVEWLSSDSTFLGKPVTRTLALETLSLRRYVFDVDSGKTLKATDTADWSGCDSLVYGNMSAISQSEYGMKPLWVIRGGSHPPLRIALADDLTFSNGYHTVCLMAPEPGDLSKTWRATKLLAPTNALEMRPPDQP